MAKNILDEGYLRSVELLKKNSSRFGVLAASPSKRASRRDYLSVFARDASICSIGMSLSGDKLLADLGRRSLVLLGEHQDRTGQIPNFIQGENKKRNYWILGSIDASLWWLLAIHYYNLHAGKKKPYYPAEKIKKALAWLHCQANPVDRLLVQAEASDWADIMPRSGKVLYSNVLWLACLALYEKKELKKAKESFETTFYPYGKGKEAEKQGNSLKLTLAELSGRKKNDHYLSFVNFLYWGKDVDVYGNLLAVLTDLASDQMKKKIIAGLLKRQKNKSLPIPVMYKPFKKGSGLWRKYMELHNQNLPHQYHNGGIWPFVSALYSLALLKQGLRTEAEAELRRTAEANKLNNWQFNEWLHGKTGKPMGMPGQSWNAGTYILAYKCLKEECGRF